MTKNDKSPLLDLSDEELRKVEAYAEQHGINIDEAASQMVSRELERRMRSRTRHTPAKNVVDFRKK